MLFYVGGLISHEKIDEVLKSGFEMVSFARALIKDPDFVSKLRKKELSRTECVPGVLNKIILVLMPLIPQFIISHINRRINKQKGK